MTALSRSPACHGLATDIQGAIASVDKRIADAQVELKRLGCYTAKPTGRFDGATITAIADYLKGRHGSPDAPKITDAFVDELRQQDFVVCVPPPPSVVQPPPSVAAHPAGDASVRCLPSLRRNGSSRVRNSSYRLVRLWRIRANPASIDRRRSPIRQFSISQRRRLPPHLPAPILFRRSDSSENDVRGRPTWLREAHSFRLPTETLPSRSFSGDCYVANMSLPLRKFVGRHILMGGDDRFPLRDWGASGKMTAEF